MDSKYTVLVGPQQLVSLPHNASNGRHILAACVLVTLLGTRNQALKQQLNLLSEFDVKLVQPPLGSFLSRSALPSPACCSPTPICPRWRVISGSRLYAWLRRLVFR
jgi:hypothetical protein